MRFKVVDGSQSAHCCFDATVVDTTKPAWGANRYEAICECFESEDAKMIADALNASERLAEALQANAEVNAQCMKEAARVDDAEARLAEAEAARLITRATLTDARRFVVMVCGETAPYAKIMLERIDKALADSQHRPADSATACGVCKGTGFHPGPYMCVICGGTGSTASAEHRHIYKHNADDTYGICECGKAFKVCPSCGMEIDATGETVDAVQKEER